MAVSCVTIHSETPCDSTSPGLCDEILIHFAPYLLGEGVRLFDHFGGPVQLEKISAADGPLATHVRYKVVRK